MPEPGRQPKSAAPRAPSVCLVSSRNHMALVRFHLPECMRRMRRHSCSGLVGPLLLDDGTLHARQGLHSPPPRVSWSWACLRHPASSYVERPPFDCTDRCAMQCNRYRPTPALSQTSSKPTVAVASPSLKRTIQTANIIPCNLFLIFYIIMHTVHFPYIQTFLAIFSSSGNSNKHHKTSGQFIFTTMI